MYNLSDHRLPGTIVHAQTLQLLEGVITCACA